MKAPLLSIALACLVAAGLKAWLVFGGYVPFNSDEAIVALMARHILQGQHPVFFYGQAYMGSLDAYLVAGGFWLLGQSVWVIRLVQTLLYLSVMLTTLWLARAAYASWQVGLAAIFLLAIPTVNMTLYTTASLGGYGEALLIGNFILLTTLSIQTDWRRNPFQGKRWKWVCLGLLSGFGLWAFGLTLVFSLAAFIFLCLYGLMSLKKLNPENTAASNLGQLVKFLWVPVLLFLAGAMIGSIPWWVYALNYGLIKLVWELGGGAIAGVEQLPWIVQVWQHFVNLILLGSTAAFGFRPPWDVTWLALPLIPFILFFWILVAVVVINEILKGSDDSGASHLLIGNQWAHLLWILVVLTLLAGFVLSPFGADPSGRYFVPLAVPLVLLAAWSMTKMRQKFGRQVYGLLGLVLVFNLWGTIQCAQRFPPGFTTQFYQPTQIDHRYDQELIRFLQEKGEFLGYSNYWVGYPLAFLSQEKLIYAPALPYHLDFRYTQRDDRYQPYREKVDASEKVAYITTHHPPLNEKLRQEMTERGITWQEIVIGDYCVFYQLSDRIHPEEIGLGITTIP